MKGILCDAQTAFRLNGLVEAEGLSRISVRLLHLRERPDLDPPGPLEWRLYWRFRR